MALEVKTGLITSPTSNGLQAISGLGFQPKAIIFYGVSQTSSGGISTAGIGMVLGFATSATNRAAFGWHDQGAVATTVTGSYFESASAIMLPNPASGVFAQADLDSIDSDGFTLDWTTTSATQY